MTDPEMPGAWICPRCNFILQKNVLHDGDGSVSADTEPICEPCPNDGTRMRPYTWREANEALFAQALKATQELKLATDRLDWLDTHCSFVADWDYCLGPYPVGKLRQLADAGIAADARKHQDDQHGQCNNTSISQ